MQIKLVRIKYNNNLYVIGKKKFWKNLFRRTLTLDEFFFVDFVWNKQTGMVEQIFLNSPSVIKAGDSITIERNNVLWENPANSDLEDMYIGVKTNIDIQNEL